MSQLESRPEWIARAAEVFARSELAVDMLSRHPEEVPVVADPGLVGFRGPLPEPRGPGIEDAMAAVRIGYRRGILATVVRALLGATQPFETFAALTRLAEDALRCTLELATRGTLGATDLAAGPFAVLALGRLGSGEMDVGSDADLVFVADETLPAESREPWRHLAERFVHVAGSHTREGLLFPVDTRLRPRGGEGEILQSQAYLSEYFRTEAQAWEAATFLKARPVAGNLELGARTVRQVHAILAERFSCPTELARQLAHTRERLETEGADPARMLGPKGEFKKVAGGHYDVDYIVAFLFLTRGLPHRLSTGGHVLRQIAALESAAPEASGLTTTQAQTLRTAALLYRSLDHALRLVTGRPANRLPEPALAQRVARLLGNWNLTPGESLEGVVEATRRQTRALYEQIVLAARA
jgi:glutamate-ammonia-ligase adenylyltransferase